MNVDTKSLAFIGKYFTLFLSDTVLKNMSHTLNHGLEWGVGRPLPHEPGQDFIFGSISFVHTKCICFPCGNTIAFNTFVCKIKFVCFCPRQKKKIIIKSAILNVYYKLFPFKVIQSRDFAFFVFERT